MIFIFFFFTSNEIGFYWNRNTINDYRFLSIYRMNTCYRQKKGDTFYGFGAGAIETTNDKITPPTEQKKNNRTNRYLCGSQFGCQFILFFELIESASIFANNKRFLSEVCYYTVLLFSLNYIIRYIIFFFAQSIQYISSYIFFYAVDPCIHSQYWLFRIQVAKEKKNSEPKKKKKEKNSYKILSFAVLSFLRFDFRGIWSFFLCGFYFILSNSSTYHTFNRSIVFYFAISCLKKKFVIILAPVILNLVLNNPF